MAKRKVFNVLLLAITSQLVKRLRNNCLAQDFGKNYKAKYRKFVEDVDANSTQSADMRTIMNSGHFSCLLQLQASETAR